MKKFSLTLIILITIFTLMAEVILQNKVAIPAGKPSGRVITGERIDYSVLIPPVAIRSSYYDYMPGSYCSSPLRVQDDGGCYVSYHATETSTATRRVYLAHIDATGNIDFNSYVSGDDIREGYSGIDIDPITQDPMVAWHADINEDTHYDNGFVYDQYHFLPGPGLLSTPFTVVDNYALFQQGILEFENDAFIWPYVFTVKAPSFNQDGKRRIYIAGNNASSHGAAGNPSENILITWADYTTEDIEFGNFENLDWNHIKIPELDGYNKEEPYWGRMQKTVAATDDGKITIFGFLSIDENFDPDNIDELVCFYNDNWGEGEWQRAGTPSGFLVDNPLNEDGSPWIVNGDGTPAEEIFFDHGAVCSHPNATFDSEGKLHLVGSHILLWVDPDDPTQTFVYHYNNYVKSYIFDLDTQDFQINDLYPQSSNPNDQQAFLPWDMNEDSIVDSFDTDGIVTPVDGWPIDWHLYADAFHANNFKVVANKNNSLMIATWQDGIYNKYFNVGGDVDYEDWNEISQIAIATSIDNGITWSDPLFLNSKIDDANYCPELEGMIPAYVYPGDVLEDLGDDNYKLHLFFYDDNSFGSFTSPASAGQDLGGTLNYMALALTIPGVSKNDNEVKEMTSLNLTNFPNPFNPTTTLNYTPSQSGNVNVSVYNVKGELIKTLINEFQTATPQSIIWNGADNNGNKVATGIYFFKVQTTNATAISKTLLLK